MRTPLILVMAMGGLLSATWFTDSGRAAEPGRDAGQKPPELRLSLQAAIEIALENNYDLLLALERGQEARGAAFTQLGALLPNLSGTTDYRKLKTFQGEFGGSPVASSPRDIWDGRARLTQPIFSLSLIQRWLAGRTGVEAADLEAEVARRDTIATAALLYMEVLRAEASVKARKSNVDLSRSLLKLTEGRKAAGVATGIDVIRAKTQVARERRFLIDARNERKRATFDLIRAIAIPDDTSLVLTDQLELVHVGEQTADEAVRVAFQNRVELRAQARREKVAELTLASVTSERIPSVDFRGDYGLVGENAGDRVGTYSAGAFLSWPLYDGRREGRISESRSQLRQEEIRRKNLIHQISIDARDARQTLELAREEALVAQEALDLALEQLRLSQRAFLVGTLTHLEVISAQNGVANARDDVIDALFNLNAGRVNLARALGQMHRIYSRPGRSVKGSLERVRIQTVQAVTRGAR